PKPRPKRSCSAVVRWNTAYPPVSIENASPSTRRWSYGPAAKGLKYVGSTKLLTGTSVSEVRILYARLWTGSHTSRAQRRRSPSKQNSFARGSPSISRASCEAVTDIASVPLVQPLPCEIDAAANTCAYGRPRWSVTCHPNSSASCALSKKWILSPRPPTVNCAASTPPPGPKSLSTWSVNAPALAPSKPPAARSFLG